MSRKYCVGAEYEHSHLESLPYTPGQWERGCKETIPLCTNYGRDLRPSTEKPRGPKGTAIRTTHGRCGSYMPSSSLANLVESISSMSQIFFFFQQNMVKKESRMSELDINQIGSQEILVQITGQTFSGSIKTVIKISIHKKPEFHSPLKKMKNPPGPLVNFILLVDRWGEKWIVSHSSTRLYSRIQES